MGRVATASAVRHAPGSPFSPAVCLDDNTPLPSLQERDGGGLLARAWGDSLYELVQAG